MRGQAHVAFQDQASATAAMRALQGFSLYGKQMRIQFARTISNSLKVPTEESLKDGQPSRPVSQQPPLPPPTQQKRPIEEVEEEEEEDMDLGD